MGPSYMIVGEAWGEHEARLGRPFVGPSGQELDRMLHDAGLMRTDAHVTNLVNRQPPNNDLSVWVAKRRTPPAADWVGWQGAWLHPIAYEGLLQLKREVEFLRPKVIIAFGNYAMWALTGKWGISDWRGSVLKCLFDEHITVVPTYHPAYILRVWADRPYVVLDLKRAKGVLEVGVNWPVYRFIIAPTFPDAVSTLSTLLQRLEAAPLHVACDIETRLGHIACVGLAWSRVDAICIPLMASGHPAGYWAEEEEFELLLLLHRLLTHPNVRVSGQNFLYDAQYFYRHLRFVPRLALDTMVAHHVCWPGTPKSLDVLSSQYCDFHCFWKHDGKEWEPKADERILWEYNCRDAVATWEIAEVLSHLVVELGFAEQCLFQHEVWWLAFDAMVLGVRVDLSSKQALSATLKHELASREAWIREVLGHDLNIRSPAQLKSLFYEQFRVPPVIDRKTHKPTTNEEALRKFAAREPLLRPLVRRILECRSIGVFRSTFVESRLDVDGRMRCGMNVAGTETFRLSTGENAFGSGMNMQNIPKGGESADADLFQFELPNIRRLFVPDPGYIIFDMDLSSADLRVVVWEAEEKELQAILDAGGNIYLEIAREFYHDRTITKQSPKYTIFKSFAHGTNYLGTARGLAGRLGLSVVEAERTQKWYLSRFPGIARWHDRLRSDLQRTRSVRNAYGYRRFFFDRIEGTVLNQAAAWVPQSTVAIATNHIWRAIRREFPYAQILLQVHDSLVGQVPAERLEEFKARIGEVAVAEVPYPNPLRIPTAVKFSPKSWGDCE